jgi:hypothetical protein
MLRAVYILELKMPNSVSVLECCNRGTIKDQLQRRQCHSHSRNKHV